MPHCPCCGTELSARDLVAKDNAFREEPDEDQSTLTDLAEGGASEGSDEGSLWDAVEISTDDLDGLGVTEPDLEPGESWNENDPVKW